MPEDSNLINLRDNQYESMECNEINEDIEMKNVETYAFETEESRLEIKLSSVEWNILKQFIKGQRKRFLVGFDDFITKKLQNMHNFNCCLKRISNWFKSDNSRKG